MKAAEFKVEVDKLDHSLQNILDNTLADMYDVILDVFNECGAYQTEKDVINSNFEYTKGILGTFFSTMDYYKKSLDVAEQDKEMEEKIVNNLLGAFFTDRLYIYELINLTHRDIFYCEKIINILKNFQEKDNLYQSLLEKLKNVKRVFDNFIKEFRELKMNVMK